MLAAFAIRKNEPIARNRVAAPIPFYDGDGQLTPGLTFDNGSGECETFTLTGGWVAANADAVELGTSGVYRVQWSQAETNDNTIIGVRLIKATYVTQYLFARIDDSNVIGAVEASGSNTALSFQTDLASDEANGHREAWCCFLDGELIDQVRKVTSYDQATGVLGFAVAFSQAPTAADHFILINK